MPTRPATHNPQPRVTRRHQVAERNWGRGRGGRPWRRLRQEILVRDAYTCCECGRIAVIGMEVDHIVSLARGGTDHPSNLRAMCRACHAAKTARGQ